MNRKPTLLIFDVDGTLTDSAGLTRRALDMAAEEIYGLKEATDGINAHGQTDQKIFFEILEKNSLERKNFPDQFDKFSECYVGHLGRLLVESDKPRLQRGVGELLEVLSNVSWIYLALGTGNTEQGAYLKLHRQGIAHHFPVGGFGSDDGDRTAVLAIAFHRAQHYYRIPFSTRDTWVIGDTPRDIFCGKRMGASVIAVATGAYTMIELARYKPDALFPEFDDVERFMDIIMGKIRLSKVGLVKDLPKEKT